jgi:hypothetical protein
MYILPKKIDYMNSNRIDKQKLVAYCGLYCGNCKQFKKGKCPGCRENEKAKWCKIRTCCIENNYDSCADCKNESSVKDCKKYNTFVSGLIELFFRTDRSECISVIKRDGKQEYVELMEKSGKMSLPKKKKA